jgi:formylglycine-generating enzyme required for sulfatase activity
MVEFRRQNEGGSWLTRLDQIAAERCEWEPGDRGVDFFGEDWILPRAFWEALDTDRIGELIDLLQSLLDRPFQDLYPQRAVQQQGTQIARGAIQAVLAACRCADRPDPAAVADPLRQAAACFDLAWPAARVSVPGMMLREDPYFAAFATRPDDGRPRDQTVGFWTAWDLFDRLLGPTRDEASERPLAVTALPGRLATPCRTARLPLLLYDPDEAQGRVALLTVTLVRDYGAFCPDPLAMGLTALRKRPDAAGDGYDADLDPQNILDSMQRIWRLTGLSHQGYRGRWSLTALTGETVQGLPKPGGANPLIVPSLSGRSAEAAVCCALWSAGGRSGDEAEQDLPLDRHATITARIDAGDGGDDPRGLRLGAVEGVPAKLRAAQGHLQLVLVAEGQPYGTAGSGLQIVPTASVGDAFERLLAMHRYVRNYQGHVEGEWNRQWAGEPGPMPDNPPFLESQRIRLLTETENPRAYLQPSFFRSQRLGAAGPVADSGLRPEAWIEISRRQFLGRESLPGCDLRRTVLTTDAGIGKTSNLEWLHWQINAARDGQLALFVPVNELPGSLDRFLPDTLVQRFRCLFRNNSVVPGNSAETLGQQVALDQQVAEQMLRRLRDQGKLVLLFDALDQTGAASAQIATLCQIVSCGEWRDCRIVVSGRPHALVLHWDKLLADRSIGWRFLQLDEFDEGQQKIYLGQTDGGQSRHDFIRPEAREILGTPRVLQYLRGLTDGELGQIRTPSDVYYKSLWHLISEGMAQDKTARSIRLPAGAEPPPKVQTNAVLGTLELLGAIAFEMTSWPGSPGEASSFGDEGWAPRPNFDQISPGDFNRFVRRIRQRVPEPTTATDIDRLAALNGILQHGFFDSGDQADGLRQILWRNPSLQEFCAAYWMSQFCTEADAQTLAGWLYLPDNPLSEAYYWIWRYAVEMPTDGRDTEAWPRAMAALYQPGDGQTARRSNEMIYRSWASIQQHARRSPAARKTLKEFLAEFEQLKCGTGGTPEQQRAAAEFAGSFLPLKTGTFLLGRPADKPVRVDEEELQKLRQLLDGYSPEELAEILRPRRQFPAGRHGDVQCLQAQAIWKERFESPQADEWKEERVQFYAGSGAKDETPAQREQTVKAFELCRDPVLNCWYRLFDPQHGLRPSWYRDDYAKYSPDPDTPVIYVDWYDAWVFCQWVCWDGRGSRLPTEREWEYAAKAGTEDQHYWWDDEFDPKKCNAAGAVGRTTAPDDGHCNAWGLRDILGNVFEWCQDWYAADYSAREGSDRVNRGGSWFSGPRHCRSANRLRDSPGAGTSAWAFAWPAVPSRPEKSGACSAGRRDSQRSAAEPNPFEPKRKA